MSPNVVRESTRAALINSPKVASYLKAGANLVERNLGALDCGAAKVKPTPAALLANLAFDLYERIVGCWSD